MRGAPLASAPFSRSLLIETLTREMSIRIQCLIHRAGKSIPYRCVDWTSRSFVGRFQAGSAAWRSVALAAGRASTLEAIHVAHGRVTRYGRRALSNVLRRRSAPITAVKTIIPHNDL